MLDTTLRLRILRITAGEVVQDLPWNAQQAAVTRELVEEGFIERVMEDDQPTAYITEAGKVYLNLLQRD